jgi:DNA modification methylase
MIRQKEELTFKHNLKHGRHGWLRLTPAYSIRVVHNILEQHPEISYMLDPFSGTGTTGLVCGERGIRCDLLDINPFLVWLAKVKTANYQPEELHQAQTSLMSAVAEALSGRAAGDLWLPAISNITRWWPENKCAFLAKLHYALTQQIPQESATRNLLMVAFCRLVIESSNAAFNHQSMSFKEEQNTLFKDEEHNLLAQRFSQLTNEIILAAATPITGQVQVIQADSRNIPQPAEGRRYDCVITSPPYPNRMSYIRELRPYMYWLGYLTDARGAADLDWQAIGGTWGVATSRLLKWESNGIRIQYSEFDSIIENIRKRSPLLAKYVHKYFSDISLHLASLYNVLAADARVFYVVGNSKFYETLVPVEAIYASLLQQNGFVDVAIETLRKRNSKKELLEFVVSARKRTA